MPDGFRIIIDQLPDYDRLLNVREKRKASKSALRKTGRHASTLVSTTIRKTYAIKASDVKRRMKLYVPRSKRYGEQGLLFIGNKPFGSVHFAKGGNRNRGVWARIKKGQRMFFPGAWIWTRRNGPPVMLAQKGAERYPTTEPVRDLGLGLSKMLGNDKRAVLRSTQDFFIRTVLAELRYRANRS